MNMDIQTSSPSAVRPLKIVHVASHNTISAGGSIQMMRLALGLKELGHDVYCVFNSKKTDATPGLGTFAPLLEAGIPIVSLPQQKLIKYRSMYLLRKFLVEQQFDVIHTHRFRALNFVYQATRGMPLRCLIGNKKNSAPIPRSWARLYGNPRVDRIIVNALEIKSLFEKTDCVPPGKVTIIYNGVDLQRFNPRIDGSAVRAEFGIRPDEFLFGTIANFARKKSHDVLFDAALQIMRTHPEVKFLAVGGKDYAEHQQRVVQAGLGERFLFAGFRKDIPQVIAALDCAVTASAKGEGLTGSLVEAMVMQKPVISTAVAGNAEVVHDRQTGLLVAPGSAAELAEAMRVMLAQPELAAAMGRAGFEHVAPLVDNRARTRIFEALYYEILQHKAGCAHQLFPSSAGSDATDLPEAS